MRKLSFLTVALTAALFFSSQFINAQTISAKTEKPATEKKTCYQQDMMMKGIPDLTDQQKKQIEDLQTPHMKEMMQFKNQMAEKHAHLKTLQTADKVDNDAINKTIDEITGLQNDMMKKCSAHRQAVRALLTDKQRVIFDAKCGKEMMGGCCRKGEGMKEYKGEATHCSHATLTEKK